MPSRPISTAFLPSSTRRLSAGRVGRAEASRDREAPRGALRPPLGEARAVRPAAVPRPGPQGEADEPGTAGDAGRPAVPRRLLTRRVEVAHFFPSPGSVPGTLPPLRHSRGCGATSPDPSHRLGRPGDFSRIWRIISGCTASSADVGRHLGMYGNFSGCGASSRDVRRLLRMWAVVCAHLIRRGGGERPLWAPAHSPGFQPGERGPHSSPRPFRGDWISPSGPSAPSACSQRKAPRQVVSGSRLTDKTKGPALSSGVLTATSPKVDEHAKLT